jgi:predicted permease
MTMDALARDTRYAVRRLTRDWRFTVAAMVILGLAIGLNATIFSGVNALLFRREAAADPARLVNIYQNDRAGQPLIVTSYAAYMEMSDYRDIFAATMASSIPTPVHYLYDGRVRSAIAEYATATYLQVLGLRPSLGRWFEDTEVRPGAPVVAILGYETWTRTFHADPSIVGRVLRIEGAAVTIIGVGPANHRGTVDIGVGTDMWMPITALPAMLPNPATQAGSSIYAPLLVKARLRDGATLAQARAAMDVLGRRLLAEHPDDFTRGGEMALGPGITVVPSAEVRIHPQADTAIVALASLVLVIVSLVLAIACSNLATLLLVRGAARAKEISVRLAMGAKRSHLVRLLLIASVLLSLSGGAAGCVVAWWSTRALQQIELPITVDLAPDYRVLAFAVTLSLATGIAFGLAPALKTTKVDLVPTLRDDGMRPIGARRLTLKNALIAIQVALSVVLLGGTSIFLQQANAARAHRVGYAVDGVAMLQTDLRFAGSDERRARTLFDDLLRRIRVTPGVQSAALLRGLPMEVTGVPVVIAGGAGQSESRVGAVRIEAGPGFFDTLRIPLLFGRVFDERDRVDTPRAAVITDTMARRYFGVTNAVGRRFRMASAADTRFDVIGVVRDTGTGRFEDDVIDPIAPPFFVSFTQTGQLPTTIVARTVGDASPLVATMQRELRGVDIGLPVITAQTMAQALETSQAAPSTIAMVLGGLAALGLMLAGIGLYAVVTFAVASRSREIGIRMALGARSQQVVWSIARSVAGLVGVGSAIGLVLSVLVMLALRAASSGDIGIGHIAVYRPQLDPVALLAIVAVPAAAAVAAAFVPSRRAALMDPLAALRHE